MLRRFLLLPILAILFISTAGPSCAWLYDAGPEQRLGVSMSGYKWVAAPFTVDRDCYATSLGAAVARGFGPTDAGFDVYLTTTWSGLPGSAMARLDQPLVPTNTQYVYYYGSLKDPVLLRAGTIYSLVLARSSPDLVCSFSLGNKPGTILAWGTSDGQTWYELSRPICVRVDGYAVPEPPLMMVCLLSIFGLSTLVRRCRRAGLAEKMTIAR